MLKKLETVCEIPLVEEENKTPFIKRYENLYLGVCFKNIEYVF